MPRRKTTKAKTFRSPLTVMVKFSGKTKYQKVAHTYSKPGKALYQKYLTNGYKPVMVINSDFGHRTPVIDEEYETVKANLR